MASDVKIVHWNKSTGHVELKMSSYFVTGYEWLIQNVVLSLLNNPGRSILDNSDGSGLSALIGSNFSLDDEEELYAEIQQCINKTNREINNQQLGLDLSPEEKLSSLSVLKIEPGQDQSEIIIKLRLINEAGRIIDLAV